MSSRVVAVAVRFGTPGAAGAGGASVVAVRGEPSTSRAVRKLNLHVPYLVVLVIKCCSGFI